MRFIVRLLWWAVVFLVVAVVAVLGLVALEAHKGPPLDPWHIFVPRELGVDSIDRADWKAYVQAEDEIFASVRAEVSQTMATDGQVPYNRYFAESPVYPARFARDWNRSFVIEPVGEVVGAAVLLHGLTDSPYSMRHVARAYADAGFVAVGIRLPGHGTVPGGLTTADWESWLAATRLAVREAQGRAGDARPLHIIGYSNGGALAVKYALDAIEDGALARVDRIVLISPMIGVTRFARFAGLAGLPAMFPAFARSAWLGTQPEFNPFKYNSFPVNGARQSHRLTDVLQTQIERMSASGGLDVLPPILTFQSVLDHTVSTRAVISGLYEYLPANGSELVLFDVNRTVKFNPMLRPDSANALDRLLPELPSRFALTIVANAAVGNTETVAKTIAAGQTEGVIRPLGIRYPAEIFSLSHVALPFPLDDGLYGLTPDPSEDFGVNLGNLVARGERGALVMNLDTILRVNSNPFFPYMLARIEEGIREQPGALSGPAFVKGIATGARNPKPRLDFEEAFPAGADEDRSYP